MGKLIVRDAARVPIPEVRRTAIPSIHRPPAKLCTRAEFAGEIGRLWREANNSFVEAGRRLNEAKEALGHGEFMSMVAADLPFSHSVANRLMRVSAALDAPEPPVPIELLPPSYATVYEVVSLTSAEQKRAIAEGIIRPDMRREDVAAFKRRVRATITDELADLLEERKRLKDRLARVEARIKELQGA